MNNFLNSKLKNKAIKLKNKNSKIYKLIAIIEILCIFFLFFHNQPNINGDEKQVNSVPEFCEKINLLNTTNSIDYPKIVTDSDNNIHMIWEEHGDKIIDNESYYVEEINYMKFHKDGTILVHPVKISIKGREPSIRVDSEDNIYMVWMENLENGNSEIFFRKHDKVGNLLINNTRITFENEMSYNPEIALDSKNNVHIVWEDYREKAEKASNRSWEVYYTKLDRNGNTLIDDKRISLNDTFRSSSPNIAIDSKDNVFIVWSDERHVNTEEKPKSSSYKNSELYYSKLNEEANFLVNNKRLTYSRFSSTGAKIGIDSDDNVHFVWMDNRNSDMENHSDNYEIYYKKIKKFWRNKC